MNLGIPIILDKVVLLGRYPDLRVNSRSELETRWLLIKGIEDKIFCLKSKEIENSNFINEIKESNYEIIDLERKIKGKVKEILDIEFNNIFEQSIGKKEPFLAYDIKENVDINTGEITLSKEYKNIDEAYLFGKNLRDDNKKIQYLDLKIEEIDRGIISLENTSIKYDLLTDKILNNNMEILKFFYRNNEINHIISYEKYKQGIGSKFYSEIAKINNFLKNKQSITIKLKNGTVFKTEPRLRNILNIYIDGSIYISSAYNQKIIEGEKFDDFQYKVEQLESLKYGKEELKINSKNLIIERTRRKYRRNRRGDVKKWGNIIRWLI